MSSWSVGNVQQHLPLDGGWLLLLAVLIGVGIAFLPLPLVVGGVGLTAVLLLILIHPLWGMGLALLLGPWGAQEDVIWGSLPVDSGQLLLLLSVLSWGAYRARRHQWILPKTPLNVPLAIFLAVGLLSLWTAPSLFSGLKEVIKWVEMGLIMLLIVDLGREQQGASRWILMMLLLAGVSQAAVGVWQFGIRDWGPEHFAILGRFYRAYGSFDQPNPFGGFMNLTALLAVGATLGWGMHLWQQRRVTRPEAVWLLFLGACAGLATLALVMSWSRGAWLGFLGGTAVLLLLWPRRWWVGVSLCSGLLTLFLVAWQFGLVPAAISSRITSFSEDLRFGDVRGVDINDANYAVLERLAHWQAAIDMAEDYPWLGVGFGNYEPAYADYALINWPYPLGHAHNYYLNLWAEVGILGLLAYLGVWGVIVGQTLYLIRRAPWRQRGILLGLMGAWVALSVHHLVDKLYVNNIYIHLGVMLGLLQLLSESNKDSDSLQHHP